MAWRTNAPPPLLPGHHQISALPALLHAMIGITGVTGQLGRLVLANLPAGPSTQHVRLLARNPAKASAVWTPPAGVTSEVKQLQYANTPETVAALRGCSVLFMVSAQEDANRLEQHFALIDACQSAGVQHLVYTSFYGASDSAEFRLARDHAKTEQYIASHLPAYTFLRNNLYADVLPLFGPKIEGPAGQGHLTPVARADIGRAAAAILAAPHRHVGKTYNLTGGGRVTLAEVAATLNAVAAQAGQRGKATFTYTDQTWAEAEQSRASYHAPDWLLAAWISTYSAIKAGEMDSVSPDIELLTGRKPLTFAEYAEQIWGPSLQ